MRAKKLAPAMAFALVASGMVAGNLHAQPADLPIPAAMTVAYPPGISVRQTPAGAVYADRKGRTLYGMDMRTVLRWSPDAALYCKDECAELWEPLLAPAAAPVNIAFPRGGGPAATQPAGFVTPQAAPDWSVIAGPQGPQWVYKGWHMAFTRKGDAAGSTAHDGMGDKIWNTLKFVPPVPTLVAPASVTARFAGGSYMLTDREGRALFTGRCALPCNDWQPLTAPMASTGLGEWSVTNAGDSPQWAWRGKLVFVSLESNPMEIPAGGKVMRP